MRRLLPEPMADVDPVDAYPVAAGPHVRANFVCSADGAATVDGRSGGLSSPADKRVFSRLRETCDVVLVGAGTARTENYGPARPSTEARERRVAAGLAAVPPIALVSRSLDFDLTRPFFTEAATRPIVLTVESAPPDARAALAAVAEVVDVGEGLVEPGAALDALADRGLARVLCEGGPTLLGAVIAAGRLDELCLTVAPVVVGPGPPRIATGPSLPMRTDLPLAHILEEDGFVFLRYSRGG